MIRQKIRLGDLLVEKGLVSETQLQHALRVQKEAGFVRKLGEILIDEGFVTERDIAEVLAEQLHLDFVDLYGKELDFKLLERFPIQVLKNAWAVPFEEDEEYIHVATADPLNYDALEVLERSVVSKPLKLYMASKEEIFHIFQRLEIVHSTRSIVEEVKREIRQHGIKNESEESAVLKLIRLIIRDAVLRNASDLHIEPDAHECSVRARVDGVLHETFIFDLEVYTALSSRIKILGNLDISERRRSQDGRFMLRIEGREFDFRLSTTPTLHGESIVMRILDQQKVLLKMSELGFEDENLKTFQDIIHQPYGIVLLTGPTGSGKTTTLYAALNEIKSIENKVLTIEDPVEYQLPLIQQVQVNEKVGFTFAEALRSFLRQDPDIIMVGEIRDFETLNAAAQASLTGHLVFSTLHTNDAPSAVSRMVQMGLEPYLIADSLIAIVAQRLVRKICPYCKTEVKPHRDMIEKVKRWLPEHPTFYKGTGCPQCEMTGYMGRTLIVEILRVNEEVAQKISEGATKMEIAKTASEEGTYRPMIENGIRKVMQGITTLEEILRVTRS
ncbi:GspE/PulE family protein [Hydrogenimonas sp. SS33]|uniref:GspE/PulE family protein n=1 Tax=Hydrogenimonas leucolamina TaxID=2954236 RepID=UPI00336BCBDD